MESQPQNPEFRHNSENFHPCFSYNKPHPVEAMFLTDQI